MPHEFALLVNLSISLVAALVFGLITERLRLSPIVGYLLAGIVLGPRTPGIVADPQMAAQFAEIGVVLLMFGVGLHFDLQDLWRVRKVALPGALGQIVVATLLGTIAVKALGFTTSEGIIVGIAISVASTVVLIRVLSDNDVLHTRRGHIAVGWLIVEDIFTVLVLVALPAVANVIGGEGKGEQNVALAIGSAVVRIVVLGLIVLGGGRRAVPWLFRQVARTRSRELFTLAVLALALSVAVASAYLFGVSMALGAFLAGMIVGQSEVSHQAAADALPMRDAFAVLFFVSVGMLFDPQAVAAQPLLLALLLAIILLAKPLAALAIVLLLRHSVTSALTISFALAQIGEFSFLLANEAIEQKLLTHSAYSLLVACAILTITLNPILFRALGPIEKWLRSKPKLWRMLASRSEAGGEQLNELARDRLAATEGEEAAQVERAVVVGYGPVGRTAAQLLRDFGVQIVIIDLNLDTVRHLADSGVAAVYGDAGRQDILEAAGIRQARYLLVTLSDVLVRTLVIINAKEMNSQLKVFTRARYLQEIAWLEEVGATHICTEEAETALGLARMLLREMGASEDRVRVEIDRVHAALRRVDRSQRDVPS